MYNYIIEEMVLGRGRGIWSIGIGMLNSSQSEEQTSITEFYELHSEHRKQLIQSRVALPSILSLAEC